MVQSCTLSQIHHGNLRFQGRGDDVGGAGVPALAGGGPDLLVGGALPVEGVEGAGGGSEEAPLRELYSTRPHPS